ncbi:hypothetical protein JD844_013924 [Phrynosoma platyrhinos]|uniref:MHC class I-like antigen recognition-like domain-containing protein n=1 Tax=Phrynosoma platyrhinos TaxID=52577 RepID=A0ABQ7TMH7_PHRPL|nr:hypothetical protein JD844_013924 [Phrynosoma platyrhinos]
MRKDGSKGGFWEYAYEGRTYITLDKETLTWTAADVPAQITKRKWDAEPTIALYWKGYLEEECIEWLQKYLDYGKETLLRRAFPSSHSLRYYYTAVSEPSDLLPQFSILGYVDDQLISQYDSYTRTKQPGAPWMKKVEENYPSYWKEGTKVSEDTEMFFRESLMTARNRFNQSGVEGGVCVSGGYKNSSVCCLNILQQRRALLHASPAPPAAAPQATLERRFYKFALMKASEEIVTGHSRIRYSDGWSLPSFSYMEDLPVMLKEKNSEML